MFVSAGVEEIGGGDAGVRGQRSNWNVGADGGDGSRDDQADGGELRHGQDGGVWIGEG